MKPVYKREHELWQELCAKLKELGAVTEQDLHSRLSEKATPGQRLLRLLRLWGDTRVELSKEENQL